MSPLPVKLEESASGPSNSIPRPAQVTDKVYVEIGVLGDPSSRFQTHISEGKGEEEKNEEREKRGERRRDIRSMRR
jgi:hypothetical protein